MDPEVYEVVEQLRSSRSMPLLRLVDDARLDGPPDPELDAAAVVEPYRWLLARVGDGLRLTPAGYLPPAVVTEAMSELGWLRNAWGKGNREEHTPVLDLRESAQRFGLVRKNRGQLLVTKVGRGLVEDPDGLWWHVADRLPDARSAPERHAGILYLLAVAAGRVADDSLLADGMTELGWSGGEARQPVSAIAAFAAARDTWALFDRLGLLPRSPRWDAPKLPPAPSAIALARAALLGRTTTTSSMPPPPRWGSEQAVELTVTLDGIDPPVWRRIVVPDSLTLRELHRVLQIAVGWQGYHLHLFDVAGVLYGDVEDLDRRPLGDEATMTVGQAAGAAAAFSYEYDFGDGWQHEIGVRQMIASLGPVTPHVVGGARACPPEDCGGPGGYQHLLDVLANPADDEHAALLDWIGATTIRTASTSQTRTRIWSWSTSTRAAGVTRRDSSRTGTAPPFGRGREECSV